MASLSDQIDRFARNTRAIKAASAKPETTLSAFTQAVLYTHLGDLIRDIDPSELGLFTLVGNTANPYDKDARSAADPRVTRAQFHGATPLKRRTTRQDPNPEIEPEVYAHAALKYIEQYEPIRAMPRAYDRIVNILNKLEGVRKSIEQLNLTLKQVAITEEPQPIKTLLETEERSIKDLQERIAELSQKKQSALKTERPKPTRPRFQPPELPQHDAKRVVSPSSPQEEQFWSNTGETGRTLRFSDNIMDEEADLGDISVTSFDGLNVEPGQLGRANPFAEGDSFVEEPTITQFVSPEIEAEGKEEFLPLPEECLLARSSAAGKPATPSDSPSLLAPSVDIASNPPGTNSPVIQTAAKAETPGTRQRRIKVNREVEKIVAKIWVTLGDTIPPPTNCSTSPSVSESLSYLQQLANQTPQLESPITSSASSASIESSTAPTAQQVLTANLLTMLLSSTPNYSLPLSQVKENLNLKAKTSGMSVAGQGTTRVLYGCVAKRLVKIDRSGREQFVKFDI